MIAGEHQSSDPPIPATTNVPFSLYDLGLLHDFTLHASLTVPRRDVTTHRDIWQQHVPQLALHHPFLMHAILSFAAAHQIHQSGPRSPVDEKPYQAARSHYDKALVGIRVLGSTVTTELADPLLCFSILICFVTLFLGVVDDLEPVDITLSLFQTIRSTMGLLNNDIVRVRLMQSKIGTLIKQSGDATQHSLPYGLDHSLNLILAFEAEENTDSSDSEAYDQLLATAVAKLKYIYTLTTSEPRSWDYILQWPITLATEHSRFLDAIARHEPRALCILAHWGVLLRNAPPKWFAGDWPNKLLEAIHSQLLGTKWERGLSWALRKELPTLSFPNSSS